MTSYDLATLLGLVALKKNNGRVHTVMHPSFDFFKIISTASVGLVGFSVKETKQ